MANKSLADIKNEIKKHQALLDRVHAARQQVRLDEGGALLREPALEEGAQFLGVGVRDGHHGAL